MSARFYELFVDYKWKIPLLNFEFTQLFGSAGPEGRVLKFHIKLPLPQQRPDNVLTFFVSSAQEEALSTQL